MSELKSVAAVWFTHTGVEPWHIGHFAAANPSIPNYVQNCPKYHYKNKYDGWRNTDRIIVAFWRERKHEFKQYSHLLLTEYDVLFNAKFEDIYLEKDYDLATRHNYPDTAQYKRNDGWRNKWWKNESELLPPGWTPRGIAPLMPMLVSTAVLDVVTDHQWDYLFEQNIFNEVRFPSIACHNGFKLSKVHMPWNQASYNDMPKDFPAGVYHPVKHPVTFLEKDYPLHKTL